MVETLIIILGIASLIILSILTAAIEYDLMIEHYYKKTLRSRLVILKAIKMYRNNMHKTSPRTYSPILNAMDSGNILSNPVYINCNELLKTKPWKYENIIPKLYLLEIEPFISRAENIVDSILL